MASSGRTRTNHRSGGYSRTLAQPTICDPDCVGDRGRSRLTTTSATPFPDLNELLTDFVGRVQSILDANLVGVYLVGSFALGGGDAASDCDFLVVTTGRVGDEHEHVLRQLHEEIPSSPGYWAYNLQGSYAPKADLPVSDRELP